MAQRWLKLSSASDGYSSSNTLHGGKIPHRLASQMVETVWQEYNINRTGHKYVRSARRRAAEQRASPARRWNELPVLLFCLLIGGSLLHWPTEPVRRNLTRLDCGTLWSPLTGYTATAQGWLQMSTNLVENLVDLVIDRQTIHLYGTSSPLIWLLMGQTLKSNLLLVFNDHHCI